MATVSPKVAAALTFYNPDDDESDIPIAAVIRDFNSAPMPHMRVATGTQNEAEDNLVAEEAADSAMNESLARDNTDPVPVVNEIGQSIDDNPNRQPNSLGEVNDALQERYRKLIDGGGSSPTELLNDISKFQLADDETTKYLKSRINDLENRTPGIDLTPLLALVRNPQRAKAAQSILGAEKAFTPLEKEKQITALNGILAQHVDKNSSIYKKAIIENKQKMDEKEIAWLKDRIQLNERQSEKLIKLKEKFGETPVIKDSASMISNSYKLVESLNDPGALKNGKINSALITQIRALRLKSFAGGAPSDTDLIVFGSGGRELYNSVLRLAEEMTTGRSLTTTDLQNFSLVAQVNAKVAARAIANTVPEYVNQTKNDIGIDEKIALNAWMQHYNNLYSAPLKTIVKGNPDLMAMPPGKILETVVEGAKSFGGSSAAPAPTPKKGGAAAKYRGKIPKDKEK